MALQDLRPRSGRELIDAAVQLMRQHYPQLLLVTVLASSPAILLRLALGDSEPYLAQLAERMGDLFAAAALSLAVSDAYLGEPVAAAVALGRVGERFRTVFGASLLQGISILIGLVVFIVPGVMLYAATFAIQQAVMIEGFGVLGAFRRSLSLARGNLGRILGTLGLTFLLYLIAMAALSLATESLLGGLNAPARVIEVANILVGAAAYPIVGIVSTLLYYDLRIRKEGFDLEMLASELGTESRQTIDASVTALP